MGEHRQVIELITPMANEAVNAGSGDNAMAELLLELGNAHHSVGEKDLALQAMATGRPWCGRRKRLSWV